MHFCIVSVKVLNRYHIFYYFKQGTTYIEESKLRKFLKALSQLSLSDWEEIEDDIDSLEHYQNIILNHKKKQEYETLCNILLLLILHFQEDYFHFL